MALTLDYWLYVESPYRSSRRLCTTCANYVKHIIAVSQIEDVACITLSQVNYNVYICVFEQIELRANFSQTTLALSRVIRICCIISLHESLLLISICSLGSFEEILGSKEAQIQPWIANIN